MTVCQASIRSKAALLCFSLLVMVLSSACRCAHCGQPSPKPSPAPADELTPNVLEAEENRKNPVLPTPESIGAGRELFMGSCTPCHGEKGNGRGKLARALDVKPPNLRRRKEQDAKTDGELFYILTNGHQHMPAQGDRWDDETRWNLINFIRTLGRGAPPKAAAGSR